MPACEPTVTMAPRRRAAMRFATARRHTNTPRTLIANSWSHSASLMSKRGLRGRPPHANKRPAEGAEGERPMLPRRYAGTLLLLGALLACASALAQPYPGK